MNATASPPNESPPPGVSNLGNVNPPRTTGPELGSGGPDNNCAGFSRDTRGGTGELMAGCSPSSEKTRFLRDAFARFRFPSVAPAARLHLRCSGTTRPSRTRSSAGIFFWAGLRLMSMRCPASQCWRGAIGSPHLGQTQFPVATLGLSRRLSAACWAGSWDRLISVFSFLSCGWVGVRWPYASTLDASPEWWCSGGGLGFFCRTSHTFPLWSWVAAFVTIKVNPSGCAWQQCYLLAPEHSHPAP